MLAGIKTTMAFVSYLLLTFIVDKNEILHGIEKGLGICLSREESYLLANYIDKDGDGHISFNEFNEKINSINHM